MTKNLNTILVDTNIAIDFLIRKDKTGLDMLKNSIEHGNVFVPDFIICEIFYVIYSTYGKSYARAEAAAIASTFLKLDGVTHSEYISKATDIYENTKLDIADCILIAKALTEGSGILTRDQALLDCYEELKEECRF